MTDFMIKRQISLAFDGNQQKMTDIECEISQESFILSILFLIYIRNLFIKIKTKYLNIKMFNFIDDTTIYIES